MDRPILNVSNEYVRIDNRLIRNLNRHDHLKYPKTIDPYKSRREIAINIIICILLLMLFVISFVKCYSGLHPFSYKILICGILLFNCILLFGFYWRSRIWANCLMNAGFYTYPKKLHNKRAIVVSIWIGTIFFFSPSLVVIKQFDPILNVSCSDVKDTMDPMQIYLTVQTIVVELCLIFYLVAVCQFRIRRHWPDIWHERLLEESAMIEDCPLMKTCELRIGNFDNTVSVNTGGEKFPTDLEIMKMQAYAIKYLRNLNNQLSEKIYRLNITDNNLQSMSQTNHQYTNYGSVDNHAEQQSSITSTVS